MITSTATQNIGIAYLSWINQELQVIAEVKQNKHNQEEKTKIMSLSGWAISVLTIISPYFLAILSIISLDLLRYIA